MGMNKVAKLLGAMIVVFGFASSAQAAVEWDSSFGANGKAQLEGEPNLGGRILAAADGGAFVGSSGFARVARVSRLGEPVIAFGDSGVAEVPSNRFPRGVTDVTGMEKDREGRILVVGVVTLPRTGGQAHRTFVVRFTREGQPDKSLGGDGLVVGPRRTGFSKPDLKPLPDGGYVLAETKSDRAVVSRFGESGKASRGFGVRGSFVFGSRTGARSNAWGVERLSSGELLVGVEVSKSIRLIRLRPNGSLDRSFGNGRGSVSVAKIVPNSVSDVQVGIAGNRVKVFAQWRKNGQRSFAVLGRKLDGSLDRDFGSNGRLELTGKRLKDSIDVGGKFRISPYLASAAFQRDGGVLVGPYSPERPLIFRITASGKIDRTFAEDGVFASDEVSDRLEPAAYANGEILAVGQGSGESLSLFKFRSRDNLGRG